MKGASAMIFSKNNTPLGYYVYAYLTEHNIPYYIGKGSKKRAWLKHPSETQPPKDNIRIIILEHNLSEIGAFALERRYIRWYGRIDLKTGVLHNLTDGGEGASGKIHSQATRKKMSLTRKGRLHSEDHCNAISAASIGKAGTNLGKKFTDEHKAKMSAAHLGKTFSKESREKMSAAKKGRIPWNKGKIYNFKKSP
ncbi:NUMOD3 domain-containing DNA-binding protein [Haliscomenobacter sp.]|uniref:NUMOD3 domain-containing DNA-binding protein n=1 Tax=Haliscomenobacter sp. TaxID=2717303 RepID=UPI0033651DD3